jgi:hypothetical protein
MVSPMERSIRIPEEHHGSRSVGSKGFLGVNPKRERMANGS